MRQLKQFQEEGDEKFDEIFGKDGPERNSDSIGRIAGCDDCYSSIRLRAEHKDFSRQQTSLAYELGKKEMLEMVLKEIEKIDFGLVTRGKAEVIVTVKHKLKKKLLALNEE